MSQQTSRQVILDQIRHSLGRGKLPEAMTAVLESRLQNRKSHLQMQRGQGTAADIFARNARAVGASVEKVATTDDVPAAITSYLKTQQWSAKIIIPAADLKWLPETDGLAIERRIAGHGDQVVVTGVLAAIAETGTVVITGSMDRPSSSLFLPEHHIVVVREEQLLHQQEELWPLLQTGDDHRYRAVHMITGPSKTADIEQTLQEGAHGPRSLHIILVA